MFMAERHFPHIYAPVLPHPIGNLFLKPVIITPQIPVPQVASSRDILVMGKTNALI